MPLQLPNLDDRRFNDLVEEARRLIPAWAPEWTNHNPSDPGITLIELFAYLSESLLYRLNRVTDDQRRKFLKLINGPDWSASADLREDMRATVLALRTRYRAVTPGDYELLATEEFDTWVKSQQQIERDGGQLVEWWQTTELDPAGTQNRPSKVDPVARAQCVPLRDLSLGIETARRETLVGHVSVVVLPERDYEQPSDFTDAAPHAQLQALWGFLDQRRTLATRHHVVGPFFVPIQPQIVAVPQKGVPAAQVEAAVLEAARYFLHPVARGAQPGWPFGRAVYVSELMALLERTEGIDYVVDVMLSSALASGDPISHVAGEPIWHDDGELIGIKLEAHHLPEARVLPEEIVVVPAHRVVPVRVRIRVISPPAADLALLQRNIHLTLRTLLHPLRGGPRADSTEGRRINLTTLRMAVTMLPGLPTVTSLTVETDPSRLFIGGSQVQAFDIRPGEIIDPRLELEIVPWT